MSKRPSSLHARLQGRDMGFDSINAFEIKISGGCGEIFLSRDLYRLATRVDSFRLLALYFSAAGHYINNWLVMASVYAQILSLAVFALARATTTVVPEFYYTSPNDPQPALIKQYIPQDTIRLEYVLQLGMLSLLPFVAELALELGFVKALFVMISHIVTGSFAFFIFKQQTTAAYFIDSLMYGGAQYIGTGRGFSITSSSFIKLFTNYGRTHVYLGFELAWLAIVLAVTMDRGGGGSYGALTWGTWLAAASLLFAPFWCVPLLRATARACTLFACSDGTMAWSLGAMWWWWQASNVWRLWCGMPRPAACFAWPHIHGQHHHALVVHALRMHVHTYTPSSLHPCMHAYQGVSPHKATDGWCPLYCTARRRFNPMTFSTAKVKRDLRAFGRWLGGEVDPDTGLTWHQWNAKQLLRTRNERGNQTDHWMNVVWGILTQVRMRVRSACVC